jgi:hypothetical protein
LTTALEVGEESTSQEDIKKLLVKSIREFLKREGLIMVYNNETSCPVASYMLL